MSNDGRRPASDGADGDPPDDPELRNRVELREQLRSSLEGDAEWLVESEQHLLTIFRFHIIVLGGFISVLSLVVSQTEPKFNDFINVYTIWAIVFWAVAALGTVVAFTVIWAKLGADEVHHSYHRADRAAEFLDYGKADIFDELDLDGLLDSSPKEFEDELIYHYIQAIHHNERQLTHVRYPFLYGGMALVLVSVLVFAIGVLVPPGNGDISTYDPEHLLDCVLPGKITGASCTLDPVHVAAQLTFLGGLLVSGFLVSQMIFSLLDLLKKLYVTDAAKPIRKMNRLFHLGLGGVHDGARKYSFRVRRKLDEFNRKWENRKTNREEEAAGDRSEQGGNK